MILRWPGRIPAGRVSDQMAMNTDIFPTLLDVLNIEPPRDRIIDGRSIASTLFSDSSSHEFLYYFSPNSPLPGAIRDQDFKLTWAAEDYGRAREHLSRMSGTEAHDVRNIYPDVYRRLHDGLAEMRSAVESNPRGWLGD